jgi:hypothetical protein
MKLAELSISPRFRGPPDSANGGYVAGLLAGYAPTPLEVRLRQPPPFDVPLAVFDVGEGALELRDEARVLASARPTDLALELPPSPSFAAASAAAGRYAGHDQHPSPGCFVCGPARADGDGLKLCTGPLGESHAAAALFAAPWIPDASLSGTRRAVRPEFMAAALDCPGYFAVSADAKLRLVGSMSLAILREVEVGERCVVLAWHLDGAGRRLRAATALYNEAGRCCAWAVASWLEVLPRAAEPA